MSVAKDDDKTLVSGEQKCIDNVMWVRHMMKSLEPDDPDETLLAVIVIHPYGGLACPKGMRPPLNG